MLHECCQPGIPGLELSLQEFKEITAILTGSGKMQEPIFLKFILKKDQHAELFPLSLFLKVSPFPGPYKLAPGHGV
jgi:hypothetical protein